MQNYHSFSVGSHNFLQNSIARAKITRFKIWLSWIVYCKELKKIFIVGLKNTILIFDVFAKNFRKQQKSVLKILTCVTYCSITSPLSDILTFNLGVIKVRYEIYSSNYQHSSILREWHFRVKNKSANFSAPYCACKIAFSINQLIIKIAFL